MKFEELLDYLGQNAPYDLLDGDVAATVDKARAGNHRDPLAGEILAALIEGADVQDLETEVDRATVVNALGPLRLKYMADDAPVEGFRMVERLIQTMDLAFNEEALRKRRTED